MTNAEIIKNLSEKLEHSQAELKRIMECSTRVMREMLDNDISFTIPGLGTFFTAVSKERKSFDPYHRRFILLPKKRRVRFHPSSTIKDELKNKRF